MPNSVIIHALHCRLYFRQRKNAETLLATPSVNSLRLLTILRQSLARCEAVPDIQQDKVKLDLGTLPLQQLTEHFYQRLAAALNDYFCPSARPPRAFFLSDTGQQEMPEPQPTETLLRQLSTHPEVLLPLARRCLHHASLHQLITCARPDQLGLLRQRFAQEQTTTAAAQRAPLRNAPDSSLQQHFAPGQTAKAAAQRAPLRNTPGVLLASALAWLLAHQHGQRWLTRHAPEPAQISMLAGTITGRELSPSLIAALFASDTLTHGQAWLRPLWQRPAVQQVIAAALSETSLRILQRRWSTGSARTATIRRNPLQSAHRPGKKMPPAEETGDTVSGAGLLLLWPLLPPLFAEMALTAEQQFISPQAREQAVATLDWLIWGDEAIDAVRLSLPALLCAAPEPNTEANKTLPASVTSTQQQQLDTWLADVIRQLPGWQKCSPTAIRQLFLQRPARKAMQAGQLLFNVQPEAWDRLLHQWPWPLTLASFPWLEAPLRIDWPFSFS